MNIQTRLWQAGSTEGSYGEAASAHNKSLSLHRWAKWIAGFSGEFANSAIRNYLAGNFHDHRAVDPEGCVVLDPFAGVGTTLVEANRLGLDCTGFEINPFAAMVCRMKMEAPRIGLDEFRNAVSEYSNYMDGAFNREPISAPPAGFKSRIPFFSPGIERRVLLTLDFISELPIPTKDLFRVAFASVMVEFSNYSYEPSLGTRPGAGKPLVSEAPVEDILSLKLHDMLEDIEEDQQSINSRIGTNGVKNIAPKWSIHERSFFEAANCIDPASVDLIVTSPPYMNNYHYVRNSRPQLFWTGLVHTASELRVLETENFGKLWQTVRSAQPIALEPKVSQLEREIDAIRKTNSDRGVYGGNGWANYVTAYMNDLDRFCELLLYVLKPGGVAVVVIGNSIVQGREIKVEESLCEIANLRGLSALDITKLRDRVGTSIVNSGTRLKNHKKTALYDSAVAIRRPV